MISMCGRYFLDIHEAALEQWLAQTELPFAYSEVFPTNQALVLEYDKKLSASVRSWGFLKWDASKRIINAKSETITTSPFFKNSYATSKAIILASGFYEWDASKARHVFTPVNDSLLYMAGIIQQDTGNFAILTQPATNPVSAIHHRQPITLQKENIEAYCSNALNVSMDTYLSVALKQHALIQQASLF
jgi:putative SOS response-associated peptidase YedK